MERWAPIIHPADRERVVAAILDAAVLGHDYEVQWRVKAPEGQPDRWFLNRGRPLTGANGSPDRYFGVIIDITEQKLAEKALRESEVRMHLAQEAARVGAWELNLADGRSHWSESLWSLFGVPKQRRGEPDLETWGPLIHSADRERAIAEFCQATAQGRVFEVEWRLNLPEGETERWFLSRGRPIAAAKGSPNRYFGVAIEISEQKRLEKALRESEERQTFLLSLNDALRATGDPDEAMAIASEMLGQKLGANRVSYAEIRQDWEGTPHLARLERWRRF